jgi:hypothetical protein
VRQAEDGLDVPASGRVAKGDDVGRGLAHDDVDQLGDEPLRSSCLEAPQMRDHF